MSELFDAWYAIASVNWFPNTVRQNRSVLRRHLHPRFGQVKVGDLTPAMIEAVYADLQRHGSVLGGPLAAGTVARIHVMLRSSLSHAMRWGWIWDNPAERTYRIVVPAPETSPPSPAEVAQLLHHVQQPDPALHLLITLATVTERAALSCSDCAGARALRHPTSAVLPGLGRGPRRPMLAETKNKHRHNFDLDPDTCELLADHAQRAARRNGGALDPRADPFAHASGAGHDR